MTLRDLIPGMRGLRRGEHSHDGRFRDSRQVVRMRCLYAVECRFGKRSSPAQVVDIGLGGMKLRCSQPPTVGELVEVSYPESPARAQQPSVPCRVEWARGRDRDGAVFVGLTYEASNELLGQSWVKGLLKELGFRPERTFQRRRYLRAEGAVPVRVGLESGQAVEARLCNLGVQGALLEGAPPLPPGTGLELTIGPFEALPSFQASGTVAQQTRQGGQSNLGVRFTELSRDAVKTLGLYLRDLLLNHWEVEAV